MTRTHLAAALLALTTAFAAPSASAFYGAIATATVADQIGQNGPSAWNYTYTVSNHSYCFVGFCDDTVLGKPISTYLAVQKFSVPFFDDSSIGNIASPEGWTFTISSEDTFGLGAGAGTLTWSALDRPNAIAIGSELGGFAYTSSFGPGKGPFQIQLLDGRTGLGDPAVPLSPHALGAGLQPFGVASPVPEPEPALMILASLGVIGAVRAARRGK